MHGVLLLDKPVGMTSNQALQTAKRLFNARKAGHTGSLDPLASGLLPLCFGEATKVSAFLLDADKKYAVKCKLGIRTTTADAEGEVLETCMLPALTRARIEQVFAQFHGMITQIPPMYSALKYRGQRLYDLAREGIEVPRAPRPVTIRTLELMAYSQDSLEFKVHCSKGTYIRTLVEDLARALGSCGHVSVLRRLTVGPYDSMHSLEELQQQAELGHVALDSLLLPVDSAVAHWPQVNLGMDAVWYFMRGQAVMVPGAPTAGWLRAYGDGRFLGLAEVLPDGRVTPRRLMNPD
ncbi:MAG TPA: tRNA pseudouridine(55) synthase TruB [Gammaproteobacteria bacterium]|nr:tRNA pseudouridine(55) synthase TruB [Gammaproteobacteria bacterium]